jgi:cytochrome P450
MRRTCDSLEEGKQHVQQRYVVQRALQQRHVLQQLRHQLLQHLQVRSDAAAGANGYSSSPVMAASAIHVIMRTICRA